MKRIISALLMCIILTSCAQNIPADLTENIGESEGISGDTRDTGTPSIAETDNVETEEEKKPFLAEEYFSNTLFIGDSVVSGLKIYTLAQRKTEPTLPGARFLETQEGVSVSDLTGSGGNGVSYTYKGVATPFDEILTKLNGDKPIGRIFIMLGNNDLAFMTKGDVQDIVNDYGDLLRIINRTLPDTEVIVMLNTPRGESNYCPNYVVNKGFNVTLLNSYVDCLRNMCEEDGVKYIDVHTPFLSAKGGMTPEYCSDNYIHLTTAGAEKLVSLINEFAEIDGVK